MEEKRLKGKIVLKDNKYFLDVAGKQEEIPVGILTDEGQLKGLVGEEVEVLFTVPKPFPVVIKPTKTKPPRCFIIVCYIPPEVLRKDFLAPVILDKAQAIILGKKFVKAKILTQEQLDTIVE